MASVGAYVLLRKVVALIWMYTFECSVTTLREDTSLDSRRTFDSRRMTLRRVVGEDAVECRDVDTWTAGRSVPCDSTTFRSDKTTIVDEIILCVGPCSYVTPQSLLPSVGFASMWKIPCAGEPDICLILGSVPVVESGMPAISKYVAVGHVSLLPVEVPQVVSQLPAPPPPVEERYKNGRNAILLWS
jgi:hypothetical protein